MSAGDCLKDSPTIALAFVQGALEADVLISADPGNDISTDGDGLFAAAVRSDVAKVIQNASQALVVGFNNASTANLNTAQFADPPTMASANPNRITIQRTGIYYITAELDFSAVNTGTWRAAGLYLQNAGAPGYGYFPDLVMRTGAAVLGNFTTNDLTPHAAMLAFLGVGSMIFLGYNHDTVGATNGLVFEDSGCSLSAALLVDLT